jgi:hypothetical protein
MFRSKASVSMSGMDELVPRQLRCLIQVEGAHDGMEELANGFDGERLIWRLAALGARSLPRPAFCSFNA